MYIKFLLILNVSCNKEIATCIYVCESRLYYIIFLLLKYISIFVGREMPLPFDATGGCLSLLLALTDVY